VLTIIKNTNHKIKHTKKIWNDKFEKYWLPAVRIQNPAGLRRFFYLPHPSSLSLSPLWISWVENEGAKGRDGVLYLGREPAARQGGGRLPPRTSAQNKFIIIYI